MKICNKCGIEKEIEAFRKSRNQCRACEVNYKREYAITHKDVIANYNFSRKDYMKKYRQDNEKELKVKRKIYHSGRKQIRKEYNLRTQVQRRLRKQKYDREHKKEAKKYRQDNRARYNFLKAIRRAGELKRTPSYSDLEAIKIFYKNCPKGMQVDHIIPLQGTTISGFHILKNLQYLTPSENFIKHNKFPYYPMEFYIQKGLIPASFEGN